MPGRLIMMLLLAVSVALIPARLWGNGLSGVDSVAMADSLVENLDSVQHIIPLQTGTDGPNNSLLLTLGHLHPIAVHFPVAWLILLALFEAAAALSGWRTRRGAPFWLLALTVASFLPALGTGLANASQQSAADQKTLELILDHRNLMFLAGGLLATVFLLSLRRGAQPGHGFLLARLALILAAAICAGAGAHLGGELVYGTDYFPF